MGTQAILNIETGASSTAVGHNALSTTIAGNNTNNFTGCVGLGANTSISGDYQMQLGDSGGPFIPMVLFKIVLMSKIKLIFKTFH